jgi:endonuclease/exonuclease/phosphatase family metal-dependent hydrolase
MTGDGDLGDGRPAHRPVDVYSLGDGLSEGAVSWVDEARPEDNKLIDFAFVEASLAGRVGKLWIDREARGSDHLPVWLEMT